MAKGETIYGITYRDPVEAKKAKKEWEGIQYILSQNDMENMEVALAVYNKLAERNLLKTEVGTKFLREWKERLLEAKEIENQRIYGFQLEDEQWLRVRERDRAEKKYKSLLSAEILSCPYFKYFVDCYYIDYGLYYTK